MHGSGGFSHSRLWARVHDSVIRALRVHGGEHDRKRQRADTLRIQTYGLSESAAKALESALAEDPEFEWIRHDDAPVDHGQTEALDWNVVIAGGAAVAVHGIDWLRRTVEANPLSPVLTVLNENTSELAGDCLLAGAAECLLESELHTGSVRAPIRDAIAQKNLEREVMTFASAPVDASVNDRLTGLMSLHMAKEFFDTEFRSAVRGHKDISCLVLDAEGLKGLSDSFGTAFRNAALRELGKLLRRLIRHADVLTRLGGAEFLMVLPNADVTQAARRARQIHRTLTEEYIVVFDQQVPVRPRLGVASRASSKAIHPEELMDFAQRAVLHDEGADGSSVSVWSWD